MNKRFAILTCGLIHSGKSTFAKKLVQRVPTLLHLERDMIKLFIAETFPRLREAELEENSQKFPLSNEINDIIIASCLRTEAFNLLLAQCHTTLETRQWRISKLRSLVPELHIVMVYFDIDPEINQKRVEATKHSTLVLNVSKTFSEALAMQKKRFQSPTPDEADTFFKVKEPEEIELVIEKIATMMQDVI